MLPIYTIASKPKVFKDTFHTDPPLDYIPAFQARPGSYFPIVIPAQGMLMARWGIRGRALVPMKHILRKRLYSVLVRGQRCVVPANCFFGNKSGKPYLVKLANERLFCLGGLYEYRDGNYHFCLLETEAADILKAHMEQMPVVLKTEHYYKWLETEHLRKVMEYADRAVEHWFDLFPVDPVILNQGPQNKNLLRPLGLSKSQQEEREKMLNSLKFNKYRTQRSK